MSASHQFSEAIVSLVAQMDSLCSFRRKFVEDEVQRKAVIVISKSG